MKISASYKQYTLNFKQAAGTSRGVLTSKKSWFLFLEQEGISGVGECSLLPGLSIDDKPGFETKINELCRQINEGTFNFDDTLHDYPSLKFGLETALLDLKNGGEHIIFPSDFNTGKRGLKTNGLVWMGTYEHMHEQILDKIGRGFSCIKMKIGSIEWEQEKKLIEAMRKNFPAHKLTIRVDANGAYSFPEAKKVLEELFALEVHSIEQPIKAGNPQLMRELCATSPLPIALDEELIGFFSFDEKRNLLENIRPQYLILKPGLLGGFKAADEWIDLATQMNIGWWATSALESNIGLNAIAQWTATKNNSLPQGLGTGQLFSNNINSPLTLVGENLFYQPRKEWDSIQS